MSDATRGSGCESIDSLGVMGVTEVRRFGARKRRVSPVVQATSLAVQTPLLATSINNMCTSVLRDTSRLCRFCDRSNRMTRAGNGMSHAKADPKLDAKIDLNQSMPVRQFSAKLERIEKRLSKRCRNRTPHNKRMQTPQVAMAEPMTTAGARPSLNPIHPAADTP